MQTSSMPLINVLLLLDSVRLLTAASITTYSSQIEYGDSHSRAGLHLLAVDPQSGSQWRRSLSLCLRFSPVLMAGSAGGRAGIIYVTDWAESTAVTFRGFFKFDLRAEVSFTAFGNKYGDKEDYK